MQTNPKVPTTQQKQASDAAVTAKLGRDVRFRIIEETGDSVVLACAGCSADFTVRVIPSNYFFTCPRCKIVGNLPGVFASRVDRQTLERSEVIPGKEDERKEKLAKIRDMFPAPEVEPPAPKIERKQST